MGKPRSPSYPNTDLRSAIEDAKVLYSEEGRTTVAPEVAVKGWSYKSLSGPARRRLHALKQYGLVDWQGKSVSISERALTLVLMSKDSPEYRKALTDAALAPEIFRELNQTHPQASDAALRHHLVVNKRFTDVGAKQLIESFRATVEFAKLDTERYNEDMEPPYQEDQESRGGLVRTHKYRWPLSPTVTAEVSLTGDKIDSKDFEMLKKYLDLAESAFEGNGESPSK